MATSRIHLLAVLLASVTLGSVVGYSFVHADVQYVTLSGGEWFVVANSYPTNGTFLGLRAGDWGQMWNVTILSPANRTQIEFVVYQQYETANETMLQHFNTTLSGAGTWTIYLDLGSAKILSPEYTDCKWTIN